jgi:hypothetical protein
MNRSKLVHLLFEAQVAAETPESLRIRVNLFLWDLLLQDFDALQQYFDRRHWQRQSSAGMKLPSTYSKIS